MKDIRRLERRLQRLEEVYARFVRDSHRRIEELERRNLSLEAQIALALGLVGRPSETAMIEYGETKTYAVSLDLSEPRNNAEILVAGFGFIVDELNGTAYMRLNRPDNEILDLRKVRSHAAHFARVYITNDAQPGGILRIRFFTDVRAMFHLTPQVRTRYRDYDVLTIYNNAPFTDQEYRTWGTSLTVMQSSGTWSLKLNDTKKPALTLDKGQVITMDFDKLYISGNGDGGPAPIQIYIGRET